MSERIDACESVDVAIKNMWLTAEDIIGYLTSCHAMRNGEASDCDKRIAQDVVSGVRDWLTSSGFKDIGLQV